MDSDPIPRVVIAVVVGALGLVVAALSSNVVLRLVAIAIAALTVLVCLGSLRRRHRREAIWTLVLVPVLALLVGIPTVVVAGAINGSAEPRVGDPGFTPRTKAAPRAAPTTERVPANLNAALRDAPDRADRLVPNGSATVLRVNLRDTWISVDVFDPRTGEEVSSSRSTGSDWSDSRKRRASDRRTFARSEIAALDLDRARGEVLEVGAKLKLVDESPHASDGITLKRRYQDDKFVAEYSISGSTIEVDDHGRIPETTGAAVLETMLPVARRVMVEAGLDVRAPIIGRFDFRAFDDAASSVSATSVQNSGGIAIRFAGGPINEIVIVPGQFPIVRPITRRGDSAGFPLAALTSETLLKVRGDVMARAKAPAYDADLVGLEVGPVPGARHDGVFIRMQVGPVSHRTGGIFTLDGRWIRDGRY
ncbi:hypothetical protein GOARA_021_00210 [Gordonia araii NBRC 100433]|uniref:Uncharacterized protein n=1 Tax=Gordonia araii NBRC 100433 TaxID=1073574 RepID=G7GYV9_9ACTN|nr:hypothetical protein [Gordonia araii]NNG96994.1 hypothetical protein [Gordonia araii NBRC 100433]GAB08784.1 hypothetical protein GOARA_021_00210 [Gordonia araii NBRC 100433]